MTEYVVVIESQQLLDFQPPQRHLTAAGFDTHPSGLDSTSRGTPIAMQKSVRATDSMEMP